jgi:hypothetical protein
MPLSQFNIIAIFYEEQQKNLQGFFSILNFAQLKSENWYIWIWIWICGYVWI